MTYQNRYTKAIRLWHWSTFLIVFLQIITVIIGKFFLNQFSNGFIIKDQLHQQGIAINMGQAFEIADSLGQRIWKVHFFLGYVLTGLFVFRVLIEFFQPGERKIIYRLKSAFLELRRARQKRSGIHSLFVQVVYILFYLLIALLIGTGLWLVFNQSPNASQELSEQIHQVKEFHQQCFFGILIFIFIHLFGVIRAERKQHQSLVSDMIHGGRTS